MVLVDITNDRRHFVNSIREERLATHHLRHTQWRIHVEATEVIIDGQELQWKRKSGKSGKKLCQAHSPSNQCKRNYRNAKTARYLLQSDNSGT